MIKIQDEKCTGCAMCEQLCPTKAIVFETRNGFRYPKVDVEKCVNCGLCEKRCPALNSIERNQFPDVYATWINNEKQRIECTSGGILFELSKKFIEDGGYVAGVSWCDGFRTAKYELIHDLKGLKRITQTKYFQPEMADIYKQVQTKLKEEEKVLFIGTPCVVAALQSFLGKDYSKLFCCEFICGGYTSQGYHEKRVIDLENKFDSKLIGVYYKNKTMGWTGFGTKFDFKNGETYYINRDDDPYEHMIGINNYITRESCFECKYRDSHRIGDLTVGDFWGITNVPEEAYKKGVSVVMVNTEKGKNLFDGVNGLIYKEKRNFWEVANGNPRLLNQMILKKEGRDTFYSDLDKLSLDAFHDKYGKIKGLNLIGKLKKIMNLNIIAFIKYNFLDKRIVREKNAFLLPYKGTRINLEKNCKIYLKGNLRLNVNRHKHSHEESCLHMLPDSEFIVEGRASFSANCTIDILKGAKLQVGKLDANYGLVIVCMNSITIGDDAEFGRNVILYDSNYHPTSLNKHTYNRPLVIGRHVWLCTGVCIAKGLTIGDGAMCGINSTIMKNVKPRSMVMGNPAKCVMEDADW